MTLYSMTEVCKILERPYHQVYYATATHQVEPMRAGRSRLFTVEDLETLRRLFDSKDGRA
jgi:hypothetical protein